MRSIPQLQDYALSPITGFLPSQPPISRLPQKYYKPWETIMGSYNALLLAGRLRDVVDDLPELGIHELRNDTQRRRAFLILSFLAHGYVWGEAQTSTFIPASIAVPWDAVSRLLQVRPVCSHASVCLWNWTPLFESEPLSLSNLATQHTFTGSTDESWFYLVSTAMEARGAPTLPIILQCIGAARRESTAEVTYNLRALAIHLDDMAVALSRMHDKCDPYIFYHKIRPYLAGWKNMADAGLPNGLCYEGCEDTPDGLYRKYSGGSNAQSALIHMLDIALGIEHKETADGHMESISSLSPKNAFMEDMRNYMPANQRKFLEHLTEITNIREYCLSHRGDAVLSEAYDACLAMLKTFRDRHLSIVSRYIIIPAGNAKRASEDSNEKLAESKGLAKVKAKSQKELKGTGGTNLMSFLKQSRDETTQMAISNWAKNLAANNYGEIDLAKADHRAFIGLAGSYGKEWDSVNGGVCGF
ncbi:Indoleamine 2,3-dioxygenase subfamily [Taphrina deformans PYCC 5710]|uniref:Indoleamine 2,3-dioxygenase n=1 Tax=Taphrina deformans (strain PYCC 5710 / ATCC 11124 / CBS 356.35 / IMI 108563 / JCM 9778 / NBRC 8474) TaxID=1097556 RepID=R4XGE4_TAPDE|nr:Indoleamine 2,3-dioxygenase subfamily [Taphrina deformans PYCC 5710]|eukprot:CCG83559.1 Indoleamine 2,3-dioxygenase subfamily [Taphrina deformans PYCC 5710]